MVGLLSSKPAGYFPRWFIMPWTEDIWGYVPDEVRPFPALTYQFAGVFGAASPVANHVINVLFHLANALLVFAIARAAAGLPPGPAAFGALVFARPADADRVGGLGDRPRRLHAGVLLHGVVPAVRAVAVPAPGGPLLVVSGLVLRRALHQAEHRHAPAGPRAGRLDAARPPAQALVGVAAAVRAVRPDDRRFPRPALCALRRGGAREHPRPRSGSGCFSSTSRRTSGGWSSESPA